MTQRAENILSYNLACLVLLSSEMDRFIKISRSLVESDIHTNYQMRLLDSDKHVFFEAYQSLLNTQSDISCKIHNLQRELRALSTDRIAAKVANSNS